MSPETAERVLRVLHQFAQRDGRTLYREFGAAMAPCGRVRFSYRGRVVSRAYLRHRLTVST